MEQNILGSNKRGIVMLKLMLALTLLSTTFFATSVMACGSPCGLFPPSHCMKSAELDEAQGILTVIYENFTTYDASHSSTSASSCVMAIAVPEDSLIHSVDQVQVLGANGDVFKSFEKFLPVEETGSAFSEMVIGLPVKWNGFQALLTEPIPGGEKVQIVIDFIVDPDVSQAELMKTLSSVILAMDAGYVDGTPVLDHLTLNFGLGHKSLPNCVKDMVAFKCEGLTGKERKTCSLQRIRECAQIFDVQGRAYQ